MKLGLILPPLSVLYHAATRARLLAYSRGWLSISKLAAPVISVGNMTTGGTGKTPLVEWVCGVVASAYPGGKKICVLTRGYGRANPESQVVVSNGTELLADAFAGGDEPRLLAEKLIGVAAVIANPNRFAAGKWAIQNLGTEVFVLDDGFQHLQLARDLDIVTIDATNPFSSESLLPYGRLREPVAGLSRAGCVVVTRTEQVADWNSVKETAQRLAESIPVFSARMVTDSVLPLSAEFEGAGDLSHQPVGAFCGVGNPESFFEHLRSAGCSLAFTRAFADHHRYQQSDIDRLIAQADSRRCSALITTAKDATKLAGFKFELPCYVLDIRVEIDDEDGLSGMINKALANSKPLGEP